MDETLRELAIVTGEMLSAAGEATLYSAAHTVWGDFGNRLQLAGADADVEAIADLIGSYRSVKKAGAQYVQYLRIEPRALGQVGIGVSGFLGIRKMAKALGDYRSLEGEENLKARLIDGLMQHAVDGYCIAAFLQVLRIDVHQDGWGQWMEAHQERAMTVLHELGVAHTVPSVLCVLAKLIEDDHQVYAWRLRCDALT